MIRPDASTHPPAPSGYRSQRDPARVLIEWREPVEIDAARSTPGVKRLLTDLTPRQRALYDAQAAAYAAAIECVNEADAYLQLGQYAPLTRRNGYLAVIKDREARWLAARDAWRWLRGN